MRITDITPLIPSFLLADRNGYALAKAIERAATILTDTIQTGVETVLDVEKMPEWRLDEMAWEYNCLYDYNADIEAKRHWIRDATPLYAALGTPKAARSFMDGYFGSSATLEENWQYGGEPYHFRLRFTDTFLPENAKEAVATIENVKNVRSVLDAFSFSVMVKSSTAYVGCAIYGQGRIVMQVPGIDADRIAWYTDESGVTLLDENGNVLMVEE